MKHLKVMMAMALAILMSSGGILLAQIRHAEADDHAEAQLEARAATAAGCQSRLPHRPRRHPAN